MSTTEQAAIPASGGEEGAQPVSQADLYAARLERIKRSIFSRFPRDKTPNINLLEKAFADAEFHHRNQSRKSGEPYILHPARVALMVAEAGMDVEAVIIALLHDVIEDTEVTKAEMRDQYGDWLAEVVDGLTKVVSTQDQVRETPVSMETYRKLITSTIRDLRTLQVKIFDRLDNMRDLGYLPRASQRRISIETLNVYVPMAQRLGMQDIGDELTALTFRYLYPKRFSATLLELKRRIQEEQVKVTSIRRMQENLLHDMIRVGVTVEPLYRKISDFIFDEKPVGKALAGFIVRVPTAQDCYRTLGALHMGSRVVPNSIKDYISNPLPNRYQALHSEVFIGGEPVPIVIVSAEMEKINARGILANWKGSHEDLARYYQSYLELLDHYSDSDDLRMEDVLRHAQMDTLQIFTPKGALLNFQQGATVLDFAFAIHSDLGLHCDGARMAGRRVSRFEELQDGEVVEVLTRPEVAPTPAWLDNVRTSRAKLAIRRFLNAQANVRAQEVGRKLFVAELKRLGQEMEALVARPEMQAILAERNLSLTQFFQQVGKDKIPIRRFLLEHQLIDRDVVRRLESQEHSLLKRYLRPMFKSPDPVLRIQDLEDGFIHMAPCCSPLLGDAIVGVQDEQGITIHRTSCPALVRIESERLINVGWELGTGKQAYRLTIQLNQDRPGLIYKVSKVMRDLKVNILDIHLFRDVRSGRADIQVDLEAIPIKTFRTLISRLRNIKELERISTGDPAPRLSEE